MFDEELLEYVDEVAEYVGDTELAPPLLLVSSALVLTAVVGEGGCGSES